MKKKKHPYFKLRKRNPPPEKIFVDKKKEANKKLCRKKIKDEEI